jgi:hypothetical protein
VKGELTELNGCRVAVVFVLINVVRERETRGGKERKMERREAVMVGKTVAGTCRSYSSSVEHEAVRTTRDKEKKMRINKGTCMGAPTRKSAPFHT